MCVLERIFNDCVMLFDASLSSVGVKRCCYGACYTVYNTSMTRHAGECNVALLTYDHIANVCVDVYGFDVYAMVDV